MGSKKKAKKKAKKKKEIKSIEDLRKVRDALILSGELDVDDGTPYRLGGFRLTDDPINFTDHADYEARDAARKSTPPATSTSGDIPLTPYQENVQNTAAWDGGEYPQVGPSTIGSPVYDENILYYQKKLKEVMDKNPEILHYINKAGGKDELRQLFYDMEDNPQGVEDYLSKQGDLNQLNRIEFDNKTQIENDQRALDMKKEKAQMEMQEVKSIEALRKLYDMKMGQGK